jgi:Restriction Endonuclease associating with ARP
MASKRPVLRQQRRWAKSAGLEVDDRGYLEDVQFNLRRPLSESTRKAFYAGAGSEFKEQRNRPAKALALHSSAVLAINVFDYWVGRQDTRLLLDSLGLSSKLVKLTFEERFDTGLPGTPPNLDVVLWLDSGFVVGMESKFTEWLAPKRPGRRAFSDKYFEAEPWTNVGLPRCQALACGIRDGAETFRVLDAAQLLKHALGLANNHRAKCRLWYIFYDLPGPASDLHTVEIERFAASTDPVLAFRALTYQDLYAKLATEKNLDREYLAYLRNRYFS